MQCIVSSAPKYTPEEQRLQQFPTPRTCSSEHNHTDYIEFPRGTGIVLVRAVGKKLLTEVELHLDLLGHFPFSDSFCFWSYLRDSFELIEQTIDLVHHRHRLRHLVIQLPLLA